MYEKVFNFIDKKRNEVLMRYFFFICRMGKSLSIFNSVFCWWGCKKVGIYLNWEGCVSWLIKIEENLVILRK